MAKKKTKDSPTNTLSKYIIIMIIGGIFGFIYEEIFYFLDLGRLIKRGTSFGPWVPIYGFGAILLLLFNKKIKNKPLLIFLNSLLICSTFELVSGYCLKNIFNLTLWDYNTEIWNWGNIGGYVCLRSSLFFGISGLFLSYVVEPFVNKIIKNNNGKIFNIFCIIIGLIYLADVIASFFIKIL